MRNRFIKKVLLMSLFAGCITGVASAADLTFDSFEEAEKAAEQRAAEYDKRMKEKVATVDGAWEQQKSDLGEGANYDISKITETRTTEQTSENEQNSKLQQSVTDSINGLKQQMQNSVSANTVGFAGASAAYNWSVSYKDGKYVLSDTYDEAFFVSGASKNDTSKTTAPDSNDGNKSDVSPSNGDGSNNSNDEPAASNPNPKNNEAPESEDPKDETTPGDEESGPVIGEVEKPSDEEPVVNETPVTTSDRVVEITIQHPTTFEEATFTVKEGDNDNIFKLDKFSIPEDTRVKISAKANMEVVNTTLTMTIIDDEGESEPIDSASMKNYRHLFRIPANEGYSANIYVNEDGKEPRKIMQLCIPVAAVDFDTRTISR